LIIDDQLDVDFLLKVGLTKTQAKVYLALLKLGTAKARALFKYTNVARPEIYRALDELQKLGLVEKEINTPYLFRTPPLDLCLQILMAQQDKQYKELQERGKFFLQKIQHTEQKKSHKSEYTLIMVEGKKRLEQYIRLQHQKARDKVEILSTSNRWLQILEFCLEDYFSGLARGVTYRVFIEDSQDQIRSNSKVSKLMSKSGFTLKVGQEPLTTNLAIFDQNEATINFFPSRPLSKSPIIITNHPSFIQMCQDHFNAIWNKSLNP
jgi:sugar-specific transcriptional regulator TrmB